MMLRFLMGIAGLSTAKTIFWERSGLLIGLAVLGIPKLRVRRLTRRRPEGALSKSMAPDGNRLPNLAAAISELRHSRPSQRRAPSSSYRMSE
jgi:hypothetical protein